MTPKITDTDYDILDGLASTMADANVVESAWYLRGYAAVLNSEDGLSQEIEHAWDYAGDVRRGAADAKAGVVWSEDLDEALAAARGIYEHVKNPKPRAVLVGLGVRYTYEPEATS